MKPEAPETNATRLEPPSDLAVALYRWAVWINDSASDAIVPLVAACVALVVVLLGAVWYLRRSAAKEANGGLTGPALSEVMRARTAAMTRGAPYKERYVEQGLFDNTFFTAKGDAVPAAIRMSKRFAAPESDDDEPQIGARDQGEGNLAFFVGAGDDPDMSGGKVASLADARCPGVHHDLRKLDGVFGPLDYMTTTFSNAAELPPTSTNIAAVLKQVQISTRKWASIVIYIAGRVRYVPLPTWPADLKTPEGNRVLEELKQRHPSDGLLEVLVDPAKPEEAASWIDIVTVLTRAKQAASARQPITVFLDVVPDEETPLKELLARALPPALQKNFALVGVERRVPKASMDAATQALALGGRSKKSAAAQVSSEMAQMIVGSLRSSGAGAASAMMGGGNQASIAKMMRQAREDEPPAMDATPAGPGGKALAEFGVYHCGVLTGETVFMHGWWRQCRARADGGEVLPQLFYAAPSLLPPVLHLNASSGPRGSVPPRMDLHNAAVEATVAGVAEAIDAASQQCAVGVVAVTGGPGKSEALRTAVWDPRVLRGHDDGVLYLDMSRAGAVAVNSAGNAQERRWIALLQQAVEQAVGSIRPLTTYADAVDAFVGIYARLTTVLVIDNCLPAPEGEATDIAARVGQAMPFLQALVEAKAEAECGGAVVVVLGETSSPFEGAAVTLDAAAKPLQVPVETIVVPAEADVEAVAEYCAYRTGARPSAEKKGVAAWARDWRLVGLVARRRPEWLLESEAQDEDACAAAVWETLDGAERDVLRRLAALSAELDVPHVAQQALLAEDFSNTPAQRQRTAGALLTLSQSGCLEVYLAGRTVVSVRPAKLLADIAAVAAAAGDEAHDAVDASEALFNAYSQRFGMYLSAPSALGRGAPPAALANDGFFFPYGVFLLPTSVFVEGGVIEETDSDDDSAKGNKKDDDAGQKKTRQRTVEPHLAGQDFLGEALSAFGFVEYLFGRAGVQCALDVIQERMPRLAPQSVAAAASMQLVHGLSGAKEVLVAAPWELRFQLLHRLAPEVAREVYWRRALSGDRALGTVDALSMANSGAEPPRPYVLPGRAGGADDIPEGLGEVMTPVCVASTFDADLPLMLAVEKAAAEMPMRDAEAAKKDDDEGEEKAALQEPKEPYPTAMGYVGKDLIVGFSDGAIRVFPAPELDLEVAPENILHGRNQGTWDATVLTKAALGDGEASAATLAVAGRAAPAPMKETRTLKPRHDHAVSNVATHFTAGETHVVTASKADRCIRLWDPSLDTCTVSKQLQRPDKDPNAAPALPFTTRVVTSTFDSAALVRDRLPDRVGINATLAKREESDAGTAVLLATRSGMANADALTYHGPENRQCVLSLSFPGAGSDPVTAATAGTIGATGDATRDPLLIAVGFKSGHMAQFVLAGTP